MLEKLGKHPEKSEKLGKTPENSGKSKNEKTQECQKNSENIRKNLEKLGKTSENSFFSENLCF